MKHKAPRIDDRTVDSIVEEADADRRSVIRRLVGLPVRGRAGARIDRALAALGISALDRTAVA